MKIPVEDVTIYAEGLDHPECIAYHPDGSLWAGGEAGQIYRITAEGRLEEIANTGGFVLGIAFSPDLTWLAVCDLGKRCVWKLDLASQHLSLLMEQVESHQINIPNYPVFDLAGNLYVSESGAFRQVTGKLLKLVANGKAEVWHEGPFNFANGMALDKTEDYLYVVCSFLPGIERVAIREDGSAGKREVFVTLPESVPDGIAFDDEGNLYISCYAPNKIYVATPHGEVSVLIDDWEAHTLANPTNIAFGGPEFDQLFTANLGRWHINRIGVGRKGLKLPCHQ